MRHLWRSWCTQFRWLLQRSFVAQLRNPQMSQGASSSPSGSASSQVRQRPCMQASHCHAALHR